MAAKQHNEIITLSVLRRELQLMEKRIGERTIERFEAQDKKFEQRLRHELEIQTEMLKEYVDYGFRKVDERFKQIDERFNQVDSRFKQIDERFMHVDGQLAKIWKKLSINTDGLVEMITRGFGESITLKDRVDNHEKRISVLERQKN